MENFLWEDVVFKLKKKQGRNLLSPWRYWAPFMRPQWTGYKNRRLGKSRGVRFDLRLVLSLYGTMRSESETAAQSSCSVTLRVSLGTRCLSSACIVVGAVTVTPAENCVSPLSPSPLLLRISIGKKKSVSPHNSQFIQANVHQPAFQAPPLDSAFDRLKMNSSQPSARYHTELLEVMALASRLAGPNNAVPSLPGLDSWLSKKKQKKKKKKKTRACS